ncbi:hypothetical protein U1708_17110 [Sphingomonas sp. ZB1N12]|jgi:hypothetical protein|uniref:hypothetical protein n=1 Tax=Sphingomonas arabinosi TaxID=3096160 RepID=UPI001223E350|nr:MAG: hypothetical protein EOP66_15835 [Sphingomonas sp.]
MATVLQPLHVERKIDYGYLLYFGLHFAGFMATTLLMTWGVFVLFFLLIGSFSLDGMMNHLQNMTSRYLAADGPRVSQFKMIVGVVHMVISGACLFFRRHAILPRDTGRRERHA